MMHGVGGFGRDDGRCDVHGQVITYVEFLHIGKYIRINDFIPHKKIRVNACVTSCSIFLHFYKLLYINIFYRHFTKMYAITYTNI